MHEPPDNDADRAISTQDVFAKWARAPVRFMVSAHGTEPAFATDPVVASRILRGATRAFSQGHPSAGVELRDSLIGEGEENVHAARRPAVALRRAEVVEVDPHDPPLLVQVYARDEAGLDGRRLVLSHSAQQFTLGRGLDNALALEDTSVSRRHAMLTRTDDGWWLADLGSTNGSFVNGVRVKDALLRDGDRVRLGGVILHALIDSPCASRLDALFGEVLVVDVLTGVATAQALDAEISRWESDSASAHTRGGIIAVDLDGLRSINQRYGELVGDEVIVALAKRLKQALPAGVTLARLGGGEFAVWFSPAVEGEAETLASAIVNHVRRAPLELDESRIDVHVTARGGSVRTQERSPIVALEALRSAVREDKRRKAPPDPEGV